MVRRLVWIALSAAAACSDVSNVPPGPTDRFYMPMGIGVYGGKLIVASSNADLRYDSATGGSVISVDPFTNVRIDGLNVQSFAGEMVIADPAACPAMDAGTGPLAIVPVRGANLLYLVRIGAVGTPELGTLTCDGCGVPVGGRERVDPYTVGLACGNGIARAYVSFLRSSDGTSQFTQVDLTKPVGAPDALQSGAYGLGQVRGFAYDPAPQRLYVNTIGVGQEMAIRWIDLAGGCLIGPDTSSGGCTSGIMSLPVGLQPRAIALSTPDPAFPTRRMYIAAQVNDPMVSGTFNTGGELLVADLVDDPAGRTFLHIVHQEPIGSGPAAVTVFPRIATRAGKRDVVALLAGDAGALWLFDDETRDLVQIGRDAASGHPTVGGSPVGLAVDPVTQGNTAHLYVSSFQDNFVVPIDVQLDDIKLPPTIRAPIVGGTP